ncbi:MAG: Receptor expression-enhancing protein 2 [Marteilia pararefringens]
MLKISTTIVPAYFSYVAIKDKKQQIHWLIFWMLISFFQMFEIFADFMLSWLPIYETLKIICIICLYPNVTNFSGLIFLKFLKPLLDKHRTSIDHNLGEIKSKGLVHILNLGELVFVYISHFLMTYHLQYKQQMQQPQNPLQSTNSTGSAPLNPGANPGNNLDLIMSLNSSFRNLPDNETVKELYDKSRRLSKQLDESEDLNYQPRPQSRK